MTLILDTAATAPTRFATLSGRTLAYRSLGAGDPILLCNRFRGTLDTWDPAFLDALATRYRVITFDATGIGRSTGEVPTDVLGMVADVRDLADALGIERCILAGWSLGGMVAQTAAACHPHLVSHLILLGTAPPGHNPHPMEDVFLETALKPVNDLDDEVVLFFEPRSPASRNAAEASHRRIAARTTDRDRPVTPGQWERLLAVGASARTDAAGARAALASTTIPVLVVMGDHDIVFPVANWHDLGRTLPTTQLIVLPLTGHGPQHQHPTLVADYIVAFLGPGLRRWA